MHHSLMRTDGGAIQVDADLWLCALDLAAVGGWKPQGTQPPTGEDLAGDRFAYYEPDRRRVLGEDASEFAKYLELALAEVSDAVVPMAGNEFGDEWTLTLLTKAAGGQALLAEQAAAAKEILSGPPKSDARELVQFLRGGEFSIHPSK